MCNQQAEAESRVEQMIESVADQKGMRRLAHRADSDAAAVFLEVEDEASDDKTGSASAVDREAGQEQWYQVVTEDGEVYRVSPVVGECDCGRAEAYWPGQGTSALTGQRRRTRSRCRHGAMAASAQTLDACPDCGAWTLASNEVFECGELLRIELYCAVCGHDRTTL